MRHQIDTVTVNGAPMEIFMYLPDGDGPYPGIILAQHIPVGHTGIENDEFTMKTAERYAENGFAVAVPFIFRWFSGTIAALSTVLQGATKATGGNCTE